MISEKSVYDLNEERTKQSKGKKLCSVTNTQWAALN